MWQNIAYFPRCGNPLLQKILSSPHFNQQMYVPGRRSPLTASSRSRSFNQSASGRRSAPPDQPATGHNFRASRRNEALPFRYLGYYCPSLELKKAGVTKTLKKCLSLSSVKWSFSFSICGVPKRTVFETQFLFYISFKINQELAVKCVYPQKRRAQVFTRNEVSPSWS